MIDLEAVYDDFNDALAPDEAEREQFTPETPEQFEWAIRKRAAANKEAEEWKRHKEYELHLLADQFDKRITAAETEGDFFEAMILRGIEAKPEGERKVKTVAGTVYVKPWDSWQWPAPELDVYADLMNFAEDHDAVKTTLDKTALKKYVKETGEVPPGVTIERKESVVIP